MVKKILNLGSGNRLIKDALNVDLLPIEHPNYVKADILEFLREKAYLEEWDEIHLHYCIEHFNLKQVEEILWRCWEALKCGGRIVILTDDFDSLVKKYLELKEKKGGLYAYLSIHYNLFCEEDSTHHKVCFNQDLLTFMLEQQGFEIEKIIREVGSLGTSILVVGVKNCRGKSEQSLLGSLGVELIRG